MRATPGVVQAVAAGSFRRMRETVGDLDILVTAHQPAAVTARFTHYDEVAQVLASGEILDCPEDPIHTRTHGVRLLRSKKVPIRDDHGRPAYLLGISEDVTDLKRAEAFRLSDLLVQSMVDYAVFLLDPDGRVKTWNLGAERLTGHDAGEILGRPLAVLA